MQSTITGNTATFEANVPADLVGKEYHYVELVAGTRKIQLANAGVAIGVLENKLEGTNDWTVRLLGCGGTYKAKCGGAIAQLSDVKASAGKAVDQNGSGRALGYLISPVGGAVDGDIAEILDVLA